MKMNDKIRVIIADDHPIFRSGLKQMIETDDLFEVIFAAENGESALQATTELQPDILVLDVDMPVMTGLQVAEELKRRGAAVSVVLLTIHNDEAMLNKAVNLGIKGYVLKDSTTNDILTCLRAVVSKQHFTSPAMTSYFFKRGERQPPPRRDVPAEIAESLAEMSDTERRILKMIAEYKTSKEIGDELCLSYRTIENYRTNLCAKLDLKGAHSLIKFALKHQNDL